MRTSIIIAAHNEGEALWQTIQSCIETCAELDYEIVIADDASVDDSVEEAQRRFPQLRIVRHDERRGRHRPRIEERARHAATFSFSSTATANPNPARLSGWCATLRR